MRARDSDDAWFEQLYRATHARVRAYVSRRSEPADVEDVVADVFATAWRRRADRRRIDLPWLLRAAHNMLLHQGRAIVRHARLLDRAAALDTAVPDHSDQVTDQYDAHRRVAHALTTLSAADREVLQLSVWDQLTPAEIGRVLGVTPGAARVRLHRASARLAAATNSDATSEIRLPEATT